MEGRKALIEKYKILTLLLGLLSAGLLVAAIIAVTTYPYDDAFTPYYLGGFLVGSGVRTCFFLHALHERHVALTVELYSCCTLTFISMNLYATWYQLKWDSHKYLPIKIQNVSSQFWKQESLIYIWWKFDALITFSTYHAIFVVYQAN